MSSTSTSSAHLRHEVDGVLGAAVDLAVAALPAVAAGLADRHARDPEGLQGLLDLVELVRLDDRGDELHADAPSVARLGSATRPAVADVLTAREPAAAEGAEVVRRLRVLLQVDAADLGVLGRSGSPIVLCRAMPMTKVTMKE